MQTAYTSAWTFMQGLHHLGIEYLRTMPYFGDYCQLWLNCTNAQADPSLYLLHKPYGHFLFGEAHFIKCL